MALGAAIIIVMMFRWFGIVIAESEAGSYDKQVDYSFRWSMAWFIFSEVMFFGAFFGALFYVRMFAVPWFLGWGRLAEPPRSRAAARVLRGADFVLAGGVAAVVGVFVVGLTFLVRALA